MNRIGSRMSLAAMITCMTMAQILFKYASLHMILDNEFLIALILNPWLWSGLVFAFAGLVFWLLTLKETSLATAYPWTALIYVLTPIASIYLFNDVLSWRYILGLTLIVCGVYISARAMSAECRV